MATNKRTDVDRDCDTNPDPITGAPGSHPDGVGIGAASGGATGMAIGAAGGPIGMAIGAVSGAIVGGLMGKGIGEWVDPTECDTYLQDNFESRSYVNKGETFDTYRPAYQYGGLAEAKHQGRTFDDIEGDLRSDWETTHAPNTGLTWDRARSAVREGFDRTIQLRQEKLHATKTPVQTGEVNVRKEVHHTTQTIEVPVEREEVVIERRPASGTASSSADFGAESIRVPVKEDQVHVSKEAVVTEEVSVGKRTVHDTEKVSDTVRKETLKVDNASGATIRDDKTTNR